LLDRRQDGLSAENGHDSPRGCATSRVDLKETFYDVEEAAAGEWFVIFKAGRPGAGAEVDRKTSGLE
jgi:hypothetical protein